MQRGLAVVVFAMASVLVFKSFVISSKQLADPTNAQISIYGLHIAKANEMKSFPTELVPLP
jgi:hypothetical protein